MNPIELFINELIKIGFFPYIIILLIVTPIVYGLLRRSRIFGDPKESVSINASISIGIALLVMASPVLLGIDLQTQLTKFFLFTTLMLFIILSFIFALSFIAPEGDITRLFEKTIGRKISVFPIIFIIVLIIIFSMFITSGVLSFFGTTTQTFSSKEFLPILILIIIFGFLGFVMWFVTRE